MRFAVTLLALSLLSTAACSARTPEPTRATDPVETEYGRLVITKASQRIVDDQLHLDIGVKNPFDAPVAGVRVLYRLHVSPDPDAPEIVRTQVETDTELAPGAEATISVELPRQAGQRGGFGSYLQVFAIRRGATELPLPPLWRVEKR